MSVLQLAKSFEDHVQAYLFQGDDQLTRGAHAVADGLPTLPNRIKPNATSEVSDAQEPWYGSAGEDFRTNENGVRKLTCGQSGMRYVEDRPQTRRQM